MILLLLLGCWALTGPIAGGRLLMTDDTNKVINFSVRSSLGRGPQKGYLLLIGPSLEGMPEKMPELLILKQACLNYCFRACLAYLFPGTLSGISPF